MLFPIRIHSSGWDILNCQTLHIYLRSSYNQSIRRLSVTSCSWLKVHPASAMRGFRSK
jgi:hypothetical protein